MALTDFSGMLVDVARERERVVVIATAGGANPLAIQSGATTLSPTSADARLVTTSLALTTGAIVGPARVGTGGAFYVTTAAASPDVAVCGMGPGDRWAGVVDLLGQSIGPGDARPFGFVGALAPDGSTRWADTAIGEVSAIVTACAPAGDGSTWVGAVVAGSGRAFGQDVAGGGLLAHLRP